MFAGLDLSVAASGDLMVWNVFGPPPPTLFGVFSFSQRFIAIPGGWIL